MRTADPAPSAATPRLVGLDLLRLLAVVLVLGRHMGAPPDHWPAAVRTILALWQRGGWIGVDLFFVLSGFLVSGLLFSEFRTKGRISPLRFYARRAWKIYPPYLVMITLTTTAILAQGFRFRPIELLAELLFFQNYVTGLWNHTWSLAVEEHFYLLLPLVCLLALRVRGGRPASLRPVLLVGAAVALGELVLRVVSLRGSPYTAESHLYQTHLRLDSLFFGVVLSYGYHFHRTVVVDALAPKRVALLIGGALLLAPAFLVPLESSPFMYTAGLTMLYLGSGMLLIAALSYDLQRSRALGALAAVGAFSYSIYLWHMPVARLGIPMLERLAGAPFGYGVRTLLYLGGSIALGMAMARLVEVPALRLRDRLHPSRARRVRGARLPRTIETPIGSAVVA